MTSNPAFCSALTRDRRHCRIVKSRKAARVMLEIQDVFDPPFEALEPAECRGPLLFNSPHSGRVYPPSFLLTSRLDLATLRRSEDSFVGELIEGVVARGYPAVRAHFPRCYVDV